MSPVQKSERFGVYFAPPESSRLTRLAEAWLGYSAWSGTAIEQSEEVDLGSESFAKIVGKPSVYGFHATLKAPMRLAEDRDFAGFEKAVTECAEALSPVLVERLVLRWIGPFLALVPDVQRQDLSRLAAVVVSHLDMFRAPLTEQEIARRNPDLLNDNQRRHLMTWGYPHVGDEFRFHMTLTSPIAPEFQQAVEQAAEAHFSDFLRKPLDVDHLVISRQADLESRFKIRSTHRLQGKSGRPSIALNAKDLVA